MASKEALGGWRLDDDRFVGLLEKLIGALAGARAVPWRRALQAQRSATAG